MDYLYLKKTLIAIFDHFLSCYDKSELEEMMQAFETGKSLVIKLPESIDRADYAEDVARMDVAKAKKVTSRIKRKKPKHQRKIETKQIKICDIPVFLDLTHLSKEKRALLKKNLKDAHKVTFSDVMIHDVHGFAKAHIFKTNKEVDDTLPRENLRAMVQHRLSSLEHDKPLSQDTLNEIKNKNSISYKGLSADEQIILHNIKEAGGDYAQDIIENMILDIKKYRNPP